MLFFIIIIVGNMGISKDNMKNKLKVYRAMHDLTQDTLAEKIGVTRQTILAIEKEKYAPSLDLAFKLAELFQVKIEDIFIYEKKAKNDK
jgi:putative transcriptional regulator